MNYWIVGVKLGGQDDMLPQFIERGYWYCWEPTQGLEVPKGGNSIGTQQERFKKISKGDRIAVKNMNVPKGTMEIRAIGIVKDIDIKEWRVYVDWKLQPNNRNVELKGCTASIHGSFKGDDQWVQEIFCI